MKKTILIALSIALALTFTTCKKDDNNGGGGGGGKGDLQKWTVITDSTLSTIYGIAYGNNRFVAVGNRGKMAYSANGASWTAVEDSKFGAGYSPINAIAYGNNRFVAVGLYGNMAYADW